MKNPYRIRLRRDGKWEMYRVKFPALPYPRSIGTKKPRIRLHGGEAECHSEGAETGREGWDARTCGCIRRLPMTLLFFSLLMCKLIWDGVKTFYAQAVVETHNPYREYRKALAEQNNTEVQK